MPPAYEDDSGAPAPSPNPSNNDSTEGFIDPSPIAPSSNGTDFTDLDEEVDDEASENTTSTNMPPLQNQALRQSELKVGKEGAVRVDRKPTFFIQVATSPPSRLAPSRTRSDDDEPPQSVIHAPAGFTEFANHAAADTDCSSPSPSWRSDKTVKSPLAPGMGKEAEQASISPTPLPLRTAIQPARGRSEGATPRAQTRNEVEQFDRRPMATNLEDIPESVQDYEAAEDQVEEDLDVIQRTIGRFRDSHEDIKTLKSALAECWKFCNTLANLSSIHRERIFNVSGKGDLQENAWKSCWKLCQDLYDSRDDADASHARPTLDLCRDFCQSLFEVRVRENEAADSVLRVSFELNNHLYNTHDRTLPEAFRERTLDFYITLCHRLMKQKSRLAEETDSLLRACWSLAEMLFNIRQSQMEGGSPDEELLGSAVQACWELCDLFREGWTQIRPDRMTPRPSQTTFTQAFQQAKQYHLVSEQSENVQRGIPETPTTLFEDTVNVSPEEAPVPNIFVIGATAQPKHTSSQFHSRASQSIQTTQYRPALLHNKRPSTSSTLSTSSQRSSRTSGTTSTTSSAHTITSPLSQLPTQSLHSFARPSSHANQQVVAAAAARDPNFHLLRLLFIKAAQISGFNRSSHVPLFTFVKSLPPDSFGNLQWQMDLLEHYKKAVAADETAFRDAGPSMRAPAGHVARAVGVMVREGGGGVGNADSNEVVPVATTVGGVEAGVGDVISQQFGWLRDLFRLVFGFHPQQAGSRKAVVVQI